MELIFDELNALNLTISTNSEITQILRTLFRADTLGYQERRNLSILKDILNAPAHTRPFIRSLYIYFDNPHDRVFTSTQQLTTLRFLQDNGWYRTYKTRLQGRPNWIEARSIREYRFEQGETEVVSVYRLIRSAGSRDIDGVMVLNVEERYLRRLMNELSGTPGPAVFVLNADNEIVVQNQRSTSPPNWTIPEDPGQLHFLDLQGESHVVQVLESPQIGLTFVAATPTKLWFELPAQLAALLLGLLGLSVFFAILATGFVTRANMRNISAIMDILDRAELGLPLPPQSPGRPRGYNETAFRIVQDFLQNKYRNLQVSEQRYKVRTLELLALQAQINPHFLFNSLDALGWTIRESSDPPPEALEIIGTLSDLLEYSLRRPNESVSLSDELHQAQTYVALQKQLYPNTSAVTWSIAGRPEKTRAISMVLQPLLENAITHGQPDNCRPGRKERCRIEVATEEVGEMTRCTVRDQGCGIEPEKLEALREQLGRNDFHTDHIGLYNTNKRLVLAFGQESALHIVSESGKGTAVSFRLPLKESSVSSGL